MTTPSAPNIPIQSPRDVFGVNKSVSGGVTVLTMRGTIDHGFEGRKIAGGITTKKLVIDMKEVRRFASWGMSEWMDFLRQIEMRDLYLVECSTYAVTRAATGVLAAQRCQGRARSGT